MSILSRVEKLDLMIGYLEEMRGNRRIKRDSCANSTTSSGTTTTSTYCSDGGRAGLNSSAGSSPVSPVKQRCRPIDAAVAETRVKGNLIDRVYHLETRLLMLEDEIEKEKREAEERSPTSSGKKKHRKGLKSLMVKSCVNIETKE